MTPLRPEEMSTRRVPTTAISAGRGTEQIIDPDAECKLPPILCTLNRLEHPGLYPSVTRDGDEE